MEDRAEDLSLVAFQYGRSPIPMKNVFYNDESGKDTVISWMFYLLQYKGHNILVDVGNSDRELFQRFGFQMEPFHKPVSLLQKYGLSPAEITEVILTHSDFDHIGDINLYKNAAIYIQDDERKACGEILKDNRTVVTFHSSEKICGRFEILCVGGHTVGSSIVRFRYKQRDYVLGGDECYVNASLTRRIPTGRSYNIEKSRAFVEEYRKPNYIVYFFHEPSVVKDDSLFQVLLP